MTKFEELLTKARTHEDVRNYGAAKELYIQAHTVATTGKRRHFCEQRIRFCRLTILREEAVDEKLDERRAQ